VSRREKFNCVSCGRTSSGPCSAGGLYVIPGTQKAVQYYLCEPCSLEAQRDPQAMSDRIETWLTRPRGRA
jgi:transcription elongation factor Elf1